MGIADFGAAITDPDENAQRWLRRMAGSVVPSGVMQIEKAYGGVFRQPKTIAEQIKSRIPGLSESVRPSYTIFGQPAIRGGTWPERLAAPWTVSTQKADPLADELVRLGVVFGEPSRKITMNRQDIKLTEEEYGRLVQEGGVIAKRMLQRKFLSQAYKHKTEEAKKEEISKVLREARDIARERMKLRPEIRKRAIVAKRESQHPIAVQ